MRAKRAKDVRRFRRGLVEEARTGGEEAEGPELCEVRRDGQECEERGKDGTGCVHS